MTIRLITRGDDAGSSRSANRAIFDAAAAGIVRNVSLLAPGPALEDATRRLAGLPDLCFGLHVTLNSEWDTPRWGPVLPPAEVPSLVDRDGCFWRTPAETHARGAKVGEMRAEAEAQLARLRSLGFRVSYLDEHMGVAWRRPELRQALASLAAAEGLQDTDGVPFLPEPPDAGLHAEAADDWIARLRAAPAGDFVLMTHPAFDDPEMQAIRGGGLPGEVARQRDRDRRGLLDPRFAAACRQRGVEIIRYCDLTRP